MIHGRWQKGVDRRTVTWRRLAWAVVCQRGLASQAKGPGFEPRRPLSQEPRCICGEINARNCPVHQTWGEGGGNTYGTGAA